MSQAGSLSAGSSWRSRIPGWLAAGVAFVGLASLLSAMVPPIDGWLRSVGAILTLFVPIAPFLPWATFILLLAAALAARKRAGWLLMLGLTLLYLLGDFLPEFPDDNTLMPGDDPIMVATAVFHLATLALLVLTYREFTARVRSRTWLASIATLVVGYSAASLIGWGLIALDPGTVAPNAYLDYAVYQVVGWIGEAPFDKIEPAGWVSFMLGLLAWAVTTAFAVVLFRSRRAANYLSPGDEAALHALLERYGNADSLGYFATRRDKAVVFSADGRAAVAYKVDLGVCLASGDPVGDPNAWDSAIAAWLALARRFGWAPGVIGASTAGATAYHRHGLSTMDLGDEAIIDTGRFSLKGADKTPLRQAVTRAAREGLSVRIRRHSQVPPNELNQAGQLADAWRGAEPERGFSMALGRFGDVADGRCVLVEALAERPGSDPEIVGLLSFVPWGPVGISLDIMRRSPQAPNGTTELMVTELCRRADEVGVRKVSLNFAMFRQVFEEGAEIGAGPVLRLWRKILVFMSRWWQLESLYKANAKYEPQWVSRHLCFADVRLLPRIGVAVAAAEGFLRVPRLSRNPRVDAHIVSSAPEVSTLMVEEPAPRRLPEQVRVRLAKAERMQANGKQPWPVAKLPTHDVATALTCPSETPVGLAGRILALRDFGGVVFLRLRDWSGEVQAVIERDTVGPVAIDAFTRDVDLGDLVRLDGRMGHSRTGEVSLLVEQWRMEAKCLHPLPSKWHGMSDPEARVRHRHVDLAINTQMRDRLQARSVVVRSLRDSLHVRGFIEVETPILQQTHGGANARPFQTHINAYDLDLYLRIAPELYLKRLCVGGMDRVFELGRTFRNEGVDFSHNPEFTILEAYQAHADYRVMMDLCRQMIQEAASAANGACVVPAPDGSLVDISGRWPVLTLVEAISAALVARGGRPIEVDSSLDHLHAMCDLAGVPWQAGWNSGEVILELYERLVEEHTTTPTFYTDFPVSVSPLTRSHRDVPGVTERWDLVAWGVELGTAYSELTDPVEQRQRLTEQSQQAAAGDPEAMELDEDFLAALEYGMPPTGGLGMGVDRIVMLVTGASIRETLPFPMSKPR